MTMQQLDSALRAFADAGGEVGTKDTLDPDAICRIAESLRLSLPESLKELYAKYDYIEYGPEELLPAKRIADQYAMLHSLFQSLPWTFLPIMADDIGGHYCVVCQEVGKEEDSEFGCVMYVPGCQPPEVEFKASDTMSFLVSRIEERMEYL